jgi:hypothetical protein
MNANHSVHAIFDRFGSIETLRESCHHYITQGNEALNRRHASFAPKEAVYSRTASYAYLILASVCEHNEGPARPHFDMFLMLGIEPGEHCTTGLTAKETTKTRAVAKRSTTTAEGRRHYGTKAKSRDIRRAENTEQLESRPLSIRSLVLLRFAVVLVDLALSLAYRSSAVGATAYVFRCCLAPRSPVRVDLGAKQRLKPSS